MKVKMRYHKSALKLHSQIAMNRLLGIGLILFLTGPWLRGQTIITDGSDFNTKFIDTSAASVSFAPAVGDTIATVANTTTGSLGTSVTYSSPFAGVISFSTTIEGNNYTLTGSNGATPLFIASPVNETATGGVSNPTTYTVSISNLLVTGGVSQGGNGASGGAGLGGAIFAGTGSQLTLTNVSIVGNSALGGDGDLVGGGGGGIGGSGAYAGNITQGGGGGLFANASTTSYQGFASNGGGANGGSYNPDGTGGSGGFGGGGGATQGNNKGGVGGFGGGGADSEGNGGFGGGGGNRDTVPGSGGFGGGGFDGGFGGISSRNLEQFASGGAGAAFGGGIFVQNNASVLVTGNASIYGNTVTGGTTHSSDYGNPIAAAAGADIFMMTGSNVTLAPGTGNTVTIGQAADNTAGKPSDVADDSVYSVSGSYVSTLGAGSGALLSIGSSSAPGGLVVLYGNNTYAGGTAITNGATLKVFQDNNLGAFDGSNSTGTVYIAGGELLTATDGFSTSRLIEGTGTVTLAAVSNTTATYHGQVTAITLNVGDGTNLGTVTLTNTANSFGSLSINGGTLAVGSQAPLGGAANGIALTNGGTLQTTFDGFATGSNISITGTGALVAVAGTTASYVGTISGGTLIINSATDSGNVILAGLNTYTGGTTLNSGTLKVSSDANLGAASGALNLSGGKLVLDFSEITSRNVAMNGGSIAVTDGNAIAFTGLISGSTSLTIGDGSAANDGTVGLTGTSTYIGDTRIDHATLQVNSGANLGQGQELQIFGGGKLVTMTTGSIINQDMTIDTTGTLAAAAGTTATYNGRIAGGSLTIGDAVNNGTVVLTGDSSYFEGTTIRNGATLEVSDDHNLGGSLGNVNLASGGKLLANSVSGFSTSRSVSITSAGTLAATNGTTATYNGSISGGALTVGDSAHHGSVVLAAANTYTGGTTVVGGTLVVANTTGSAVGNGALVVNSGATLGGNGIINDSGNTINGNVTVGSGGTNTTDVLTMKASTSNTFSGATLTFNLDSTTLGQGNQLDVGATATSFSGTSVVLNILNGAIVPDSTPFTLFTSTAMGSGDGGSIFSGLGLSGGKITGLGLTINSAQGTGSYANSYLQLVSNSKGGYDIDVEVVPEPGTWALMLMGGGLLILLRRRIVS